MFFVFFKQKTAYDMRISDWSSDVCSSDLRQRRRRRPSVQRDQKRDDYRAGGRQDRGARPAGVHGAQRRQRHGGLRNGRRPVGEARQSVGSGKSVSVRVDLGGWRMIKKKKTTSITQQSMK